MWLVVVVFIAKLFKFPFVAHATSARCSTLFSYFTGVPLEGAHQDMMLEIVKSMLLVVRALTI